MEVKAVVCLFWISVQRISSLEEILESTQDIVTDADVDFRRLENDYAVAGNVSTSGELYDRNKTAEQEIPVVPTEIPQTKSDNDTIFRASVHLGEIEESRSFNQNPFNKLSQLKFDNILSVQPKTQNWFTGARLNNEGNYFDKTNIVDNINLTPPKSSFFPTSIANDNHYLPTHANRAPSSQISPLFQSQNIIPTEFQNSLQPSYLQRPEFPIYSPDKTYYETYVHESSPQSFDVSGSFHDDANFVTPFNDLANVDYTKQGSFGSYEEPNGLKVHSEIRDILPTRNQRFPYKFYHETPTFPAHSLQEYTVADEQIFHTAPRQRRISPWKKIIHLIGTILPFGLLLATLTPNIIQISNSTQSTIPLSKLKDLDLPPEHKSLRMIDDRNSACEEKNICEVILAGSKPRSNLLQNILWNFVMRTSEETAKDNGLRELFQAVKKRDCNLISCLTRRIGSDE